MSENDAVIEEITSAVDAVGRRLWDFRTSSGAVSAAANFLVSTSVGPLPVSLETDEDGNVIWVSQGDRHIVVYPDGQLARNA
jgi:hypothetical protein